MPMSFHTIVLEVNADDRVATITLNRPEQLNAFNRTMCEEMREAWHAVKLDESVNAVVLRAAGTGVQRRPRHHDAVRPAGKCLES